MLIKKHKQPNAFVNIEIICNTFFIIGFFRNQSSSLFIRPVVLNPHQNHLRSLEIDTLTPR